MDAAKTRGSFIFGAAALQREPTSRYAASKIADAPRFPGGGAGLALAAPVILWHCQ